MQWVSLHNHTTYSYGDGYGPVPAHVARAVELGMKALSVTEHGNVSSHAQLEIHCKKTGIKPIYGIEIYLSRTADATRKTHMILIAYNAEGYRNLNRIVTHSYTDPHKERWPTVYFDRIREYSDGLIALSGCSDSELSCTLLGGKDYGEKRLTYTEDDYSAAARVIERYAKVFGDRYFLECQRFPALERTRVLNTAFEKLGRSTGVPLVGTADVHYPLPEQNKVQAILHAARRGGTVEQTEASWEYDVLLTYPTSDEEITNDLVATGLSESAAYAAVTNTSLIAARCNVELPKVERVRYPISERDWEPWETV